MDLENATTPPIAAKWMTLERTDVCKVTDKTTDTATFIYLFPIYISRHHSIGNYCRQGWIMDLKTTTAKCSQVDQFGQDESVQGYS